MEPACQRIIETNSTVMGFMENFNKEPALPQQRFWYWFLGNSKRVSALIDDPGLGMDIHEELTTEIKRVQEAIVPELTRDADGSDVLVLSADGRKEGVEPVIALADAAPDIPGWSVERFRKPGPEDMCIEYQGLSVDASGIRIAYQGDKDAPLLHIAMLIPG